MCSHRGGDGAHWRWPQTGSGEEHRALVKDRGNSLWQSQVLAALVGLMGRFLPSVSDWYLIFQRWNVRFVALFPWLRGIY